MTDMPVRLAIDLSHTLDLPQYTGIQRFVRHVLRQTAALAREQGGLDVHAVQARADGQWRSIAALPGHPLEQRGPVRLRPGEEEDFRFDAATRVLLADRFWHTGAWAALARLVASGARISLVVYDLLSLQQPQWFPGNVGQRFQRYLETVIPHADSIICLTSAVRGEMLAWCASRGLQAPPVHVIPPGLDVWPSREGSTPAGLPPAWREGNARFVLQVGTLEPRKNHALTLQAMQALWDAGRPEGLLLIGQQGWLTDALCERLRRHPRVVWLPQCTDPELQWCYRHAGAVLFPSQAEGYGLPPAEAAAMGTPVVASDTEVHREVAALVAGPGRFFFSATCAQALAAVLPQALALPPAAPARATRTWRDTAEALLRTMADQGGTPAITCPAREALQL